MDFPKADGSDSTYKDEIHEDGEIGQVNMQSLKFGEEYVPKPNNVNKSLRLDKKQLANMQLNLKSSVLKSQKLSANPSLFSAGN